MNTSYNPRLLASEIERHFQRFSDTENILIFKGIRGIYVTRGSVNKKFHKTFLRVWGKSK